GREDILSFMSLPLRKLLLLTVFLATCGRAWAMTESEALVLINDYRGSLADGRKEIIRGAWTNLNNAPEAVAYLQTNFPSLFASYRLEGLAMEWEALGIAFQKEKLKGELEFQEAQKKIFQETHSVFRAGPIPNEKTALQFPNQVTPLTANNAVR